MEGKRLHGQFVREIPETTHVEEAWSWLRKANLTIQTEALICAGQEQALRTNYVKYHIDKTVESSLRRLFGEKGESVDHMSVKNWPKGNTNRDMKTLQK